MFHNLSEKMTSVGVLYNTMHFLRAKPCNLYDLKNFENGQQLQKESKMLSMLNLSTQPINEFLDLASLLLPTCDPHPLHKCTHECGLDY
jgi:hypothetical protein